MANRRTEEGPLIIEDFQGVNQFIDDFTLKPEVPQYLFGAFVNDKMNVERVPGKLLHSSNTTGGHVLTLYQLIFSNESVLLVHQGSEYKVETDLSSLFVDEPVPVSSPMEPFIF